MPILLRRPSHPKSIAVSTTATLCLSFSLLLIHMPTENTLLLKANPLKTKIHASLLTTHGSYNCITFNYAWFLPFSPDIFALTYLQIRMTPLTIAGTAAMDNKDWDSIMPFGVIAKIAAP